MLSIVVPGHNEAGNIPRLVTAIREAMTGVPMAYELIYADDASSDESWNILQRLGSEDTRIRALRLGTNCGQSAALWAGIRMARGRIIATMDADLQNDPAELPKFLEALKGCDCVCGSRSLSRRSGDNLTRHLSSRVANHVRNRITRETIRDSGCGYRVFKSECAANQIFFNGMHRFLPTLFKTEGFSVVEIPISHHARMAGKSHYGIWNRLFVAVSDLMAVRWMQNRAIRYTIVESANIPECRGVKPDSGTTRVSGCEQTLSNTN